MKLTTFPLPGQRQLALVDGKPLLTTLIARESRSQPGRLKVAFTAQVGDKAVLVPVSNTPGVIDVRLEMS